MSNYSFGKSEHLVSNKSIELLFSSGSRSLSVYPIRAVFRPTDDKEHPAKVLISVSKRHLRHAVDRNRAKRQIREAYRLNKSILWEILEQKEQHLNIAFIWMSNQPESSRDVHHSIIKLLQLIGERL